MKRNFFLFLSVLTITGCSQFNNNLEEVMETKLAEEELSVSEETKQ